MKFCHNCGVNLEEHLGARFCWNCGITLDLEEKLTFSTQRKSTQPKNVIIASLKSILDAKADPIKYFYRKSFKTKYSDCWNNEENELNQVLSFLKSALNSGIDSRIEEGISKFTSYLLIDASGKSEKISDVNMKSFLNTSDGRKYGDLHTLIINLINDLSSFFSDIVNNSIIESSNTGMINQNSENQSDLPNFSSEFQKGFDSYGIIYTSIATLANRLNSSETQIGKMISSYISEIEKTGHQYILLNANDNTYQNVDSDDVWQAHVELIKRQYQDSTIKPDYLFIIGGHDIIPMAVINNEAGCYEDDTDIDTDMPYSYLKDNNFESLLWNGTIFKENLLLNVGRLPLATDSDINDLQMYLDRVSKSISANVQINDCFGMTAFSWKSASDKILRNTKASKALHCSPLIDINSVDNVYNNSSELYYYNLHGSDAPSASQFYGDNESAIAPKHIAKAVNPNFFITEACYGAKFIDYNKESSMLHSALNGNTLAFVGSSRVAFGACTENISSADIIAKSFIDSLFDGVTCGMALSKARIDVFDNCSNEQYNYGVTSAVQFNLFGDPILMAASHSKSIVCQKNSAIKSKSFNKTKPEIKEINIQNLDKGILNDVRNLVNNEILKIREIVDNYLYQNFNVDKRNLYKIFSIKSKFGEETYSYVYQKQNGIIKNTYSVFTDKRGNIKSILTSK